MKCSVFIILISALLGGACNTDCETPGVYIGFSGFDSSELAAVIIKRYEANSNYTTLVSTNYSGIQNDRPYQAVFSDGDTIGYSSIGRIHTGYDYEYILPSANRTFRLGGFSIDHKKADWSPIMTPSCGNTVYYYLDGKLGSGDGYMGTKNHYGDLGIGLVK